MFGMFFSKGISKTSFMLINWMDYFLLNKATTLILLVFYWTPMQRFHFALLFSLLNIECCNGLWFVSSFHFYKAVIRRGEFGTLGPDGNCWPQMACMIPSFDNIDKVVLLLLQLNTKTDIKPTNNPKCSSVWFQFDWEGDLPLKYPQKDLIIYEMHVRGFTRHESSRIEFPGTYLGAVDKLDHLKVYL